MTGKRKLFEGHDFSDIDTLALLNLGRKNISETGAPLVPMNIIIEDPDQPRTEFDDAALEEMAESIRERGVLQPIVIKAANPDGFHVIIAGARRFRASKLAGKNMIPALVRHAAADSYDQMIENIQREALSHRDIARFIRDQLATGAKKSEIAKSLGKPPAWVSLYVDFFDMDPVIQAGGGEFGTRAAHELHAAMQIDAEKTRAFITSGEPVTQRSAVAFRQSLKTGQGAPSTPQKPVVPSSPESIPFVEPKSSNDSPKVESVSPPPFELEDGSPASATPPLPKPAPPSTEPSLSSPDAPGSSETEPLASQELPFVPAARKTGASLAMRVREGERVGRLFLDRKAGQGASFGVVVFDDGAKEEPELSNLVLMEFVEPDEKESDDA